MNNPRIALTPLECDVSNFPFMPLDIDRLLNSETWILGDDSEKVASFTLWLKSWSQIPAASIPNNDKMLAHLSGMGSKWKKVKEHALRGWVDGGDGRLYHHVVAEKALEAWIEKLANAISGAQGNAKRWSIQIDTSELESQLRDAVYRLKTIAPQSKALTKKIAKIVESASPTVSGGDNNPNRQGIAIDSKENRQGIDNINTHSNGTSENLLDADLSLWKPSLHEINSWRQRAGLPKTTQDEFDTFMITFLPHYAPEIRSGRLIENKIYAKYIQWVKDDALKASRLAKSKPAVKTNSANDSRNVNDAWKDEPKSDDRPFTGTVNIPEDF
ncbi:DUF1376 domain-containing protein [Acinetobacter pittii]|uniref:DUF1376 domain-containing protein n=1 Tax=Acinetobacter pittii TaxID=48296 RepID=UPI0004F52898|nr:DUF1376 domain-containing protein [Acinetobacter pittii]KQE75138.1 hypothetical protein APB92_14565 [Acinetobacter pittii]MBJ8490937.1 DUF1376 domain-containing protein [Acinetobacter pittii]MCU4466672.1 YdaU family protein [Acinetobacter pittii]MCU4556969.1 YdaU family protein [Acinetobacter pittii]OTM46473.1 DUF1376 domain-containing protein [Acinetobacter pittii]